MVVAMRRVLELAYHVLLVRCGSSWSHICHIRLVPADELGFLIRKVAQAMTFLLPFRLHNVILSHVDGGHCVFARVQDLVRITEIIVLARALPVHVGVRLD